MHLDLTADQLIAALMHIASERPVCILDSCGVGHLGSHLLIAGIEPVEMIEAAVSNADETLGLLDTKTTGKHASIFSLSYELGQKLLGIEATKTKAEINEPDLFLAVFDVLIVHDYDSGLTSLTGDTKQFDDVAKLLLEQISNIKSEISNLRSPGISDLRSTATSNFSKGDYLRAIEAIRNEIRQGNTYQTNLTQQIAAKLPEELTPGVIFQRLRRDNPAPFSAFLRRSDSTVVSASPERFFTIGRNPNGSEVARRVISTSPIKGTRPRGRTKREDEALKAQLLSSLKDRAENTMIVDLLRNDLGRVCEFGSVRVEKLCDIEEHPTLFHLVSTISGELRNDARFSDIVKALFPCGSITGAPKISTMRIIEEIEPTNRGLSMGAIGYCIPDGFSGLTPTTDLSVAIRTMVLRDRTATFNVGGGIVIDSDPESEYEETLIKAKALLSAIGAKSEFEV